MIRKTIPINPYAVYLRKKDTSSSGQCQGQLNPNLDWTTIDYSIPIVPGEADGTSAHSPAFIADEKAIPAGVDLLSAVIRDYPAMK